MSILLIKKTFFYKNYQTYSNKNLKYFIVGDNIAFIIPIIQDFSFDIKDIYI